MLKSAAKLPLGKGKGCVMCPGSEDEQPWHKWWRGRNFLLPPVFRGHEHQWGHVDAGIVGCILCGLVHVCERGDKNAVPCENEYTDQGSCVCALTGLQLCPSILIDEHMDVDSYNRNRTSVYTSGTVSVARQTDTFQDNLQTIRDTVHSVIDLLVFSNKATRAQREELQRYYTKTKTALLHFDSRYRGKTQRFDLVLALEFIVVTTRLSRIPVTCMTLPNATHFKTLKRYLVVLAQQLEVVTMQSQRLNPERITRFTVGMLYVCTHGLAARGQTLIPPHPELARLLPLQAALSEIFMFHPKIITEAENHAKRIINNMSPRAFERLSSSLHDLKHVPCPYSPSTGGCRCESVREQ